MEAAGNKRPSVNPAWNISRHTSQKEYLSMQPVNDNRLQHQILPARQKIPGQRETAPQPAKTPPVRAASAFPEDVVNLSTDRDAILSPSVKKPPSIPVTTMEKKALRESFSVYA